MLICDDVITNDGELLHYVTINFFPFIIIYTPAGGCLSNGDTFGAIQSVLISEVILYIICAFGTNESVLIREVS